jgi:hypothetical protein
MPSRIELHKDELPLHFEGVGLKPAIRSLGWPFGLVGVVGGTYLVAAGEDFGLELLGVLVAGCCGLLLVGLLRCRRFETVLGTRMLMVAAGPIRKRVPVRYVEELVPRSARSWRRLYADHELVMRLRVGNRPVVVPSDRPDELIAAVKALQSE